MSLLCSSLFLLHTGTSAAEPKDPKALMEEIDANISRGTKEYRACEKFKKKFKRIISGGLSIDSPSHLNKKQALDYMAALERYPAFPSAYRRAHEIYAENAEVLLKEPLPADIAQRWATYQQECIMYSVQVHMTLLFRDVEAFDFSKKERAKVESLAKAYFHSQNPFLATTTAWAKGKALETYLDKVYQGENREALLVQAQDLNRSVRKKQDEVRVRSEKPAVNLPAGAVDATKAIDLAKMEVAAVRELSGAYSEILKSGKL